MFAHPDLDVVRDADRRIEEVLARLDLRVNRSKSQNLYLTTAGHHPKEWENGKGTTSIPFVGTNISARGTVALNRKKLRAFLRDIERRAMNTVDSLKIRDREYVGQVVCSVVNRVLASHVTVGRATSVSLVRRVVTDRNQIAQLDY